MTQEFVTLPRSVLEWALDAFETDDWQKKLQAAIALRAALEQTQNQSGGIPPNWKLVPVEPTREMLRSAFPASGPVTANAVYRAMLDAAPQPPTTEQSSVVEHPQVEQEPVAWIREEWSSRTLNFDGPPTVPSVRDELTKPVWTPLYTNPQPQHEPLTDEQIIDIADELQNSVDSLRSNIRPV